MASTPNPYTHPGYREAERMELSRERVLAWAALAKGAKDAGDLRLAVLAKQEEVHDANFLQMIQHCLVAAGEMIELYDALRASGGAASTDGRTVIWGLKYAVACAIGVPEIPFATVDGLITMLGSVLESCGYRPYAMWQAEANRYYRSGDTGRVAELAERLLPTISYINHIRFQADCPSCCFYELARFRGPRATPGEIEPILRPVLRGEEVCEESPMLAEALYAVALARAGDGAEAREHATRSLAMRHGASGEARVEPVVARLEAARAERDAPALREWLGALEARFAGVEDAYDRQWAQLAAYRAARRLAALDAGEGAARCERLASDVRALAARLDARTPGTTRHADEAALELGAADAEG